MRELDIEKSILIYLNQVPGYFAFKNIKVGIFDPKTRRMRLPPKWHNNQGVADITVFHKGSVFYIEVKNEKGKQSDLQGEFESSCRCHGVRYYIARSLDDVRMLVDCRKTQTI